MRDRGRGKGRRDIPVLVPRTSVLGHKPGLISLASLNLTFNSPPNTFIQCIPCAGVLTGGLVFLEASIDLVAVLSMTMDLAMY